MCSTNNIHTNLEQVETSESDSEDGASNLCIFDSTIGHIEDILIDEEFLDIQNNFLEKYWMEFDETEENKLLYTTIFKEYVSKLEQYIENKLKQNIPQFYMANFLEQLLERKDTLEGEVFEMLYTLSDFIAFKEMFLDYRKVKEGRIADFSNSISITPITFDDDSV